MRLPAWWPKASVVALAFVALIAGSPMAASLGEGGMGAGPTPGSDPFGFTTHAGLTPVDASASWGLVESQYSMADVDPLTGALQGSDAGSPLTLQHAMEMDLMAAGVLAVDAAEIAHQTRMLQAQQRENRRRRGLAVERGDDPGNPEPWELTDFGACLEANAGYEGRIELVELFTRMCDDALDDGVRLTINSAYRSPEHQHRLFQSAVSRYGSESAARRWVAYSDGETCHSRHCSGTAVDVGLSGNPGAREWMHEPVGCWSQSGGLAMGQTSCSSGQTQVIRANLYGLVIPLSHEPWHVEVGIPLQTEFAGDADCAPPPGTPVPNKVASIFRCKMLDAGYSAQEADRVAAEAVVVSRCESAWNADAVVFGGRYVNSPHPSTGLRYTAAGVMQFIRSSAERWVPGGYANVHDPTANITGAADYYLATREGSGRGWEPWACAAANDGFKDSSELPGWPGGPDRLPDWAWEY